MLKPFINATMAGRIRSRCSVPVAFTLNAYSGEADHDSDLMPIGIPA
jgi:hypothetical protein